MKRKKRPQHPSRSAPPTLIRLAVSLFFLFLLSLPSRHAQADGSASSHDAAAVVSVNGEELFSLHDTIGKAGPAARASEANRVLDELKTLRTTNVRLVPSEHGITVYGAQRPIVELTQLDSEGAGRAELKVFADEVKSRITRSLVQERTRSVIAKRVLSVSSVVFLGLLALLLLRGVGNAARRAREQLDDEQREFGSLKVDQVELLPKGAVREGLRVLLFSGSWAAHLAIVYGYLLVSFSLFDSTRKIAQSATGHLLAPVGELLERLAGNLPLAFSVIVVLALTAVLVRFIQSYVRAIEKGSVENEWFNPDTARVTGHLLSTILVLSTLLFVTPLLTGTSDGVLQRIGVLGTGAIALACSPLLVSAAIGARQVYSRLLRRGDEVEYGGRRGVVVRVELFELALRSEDGARVRVPHLLSLIHPTIIFPIRPPSSAEPLSPAEPLSSAETPAP